MESLEVPEIVELGGKGFAVLDATKWSAAMRSGTVSGGAVRWIEKRG